MTRADYICGEEMFKRGRLLLSAVACAFITALFLAYFAPRAEAGPLGETTLPIDEVASNVYEGPATSAALAGNSLTNVGDVNGDGRNDLVANSNGASHRGGFVLFTPKRKYSDLKTADLAPSEGYRIRAANGSSVFLDSAGDQNGDGIDDFLIRLSTSDLVVIYGLEAADIELLPKCGGVDAVERTRCLDIPASTANPFEPAPPAGGYRITGVSLAPSQGGQNYSAGDLNDDGKPEIIVKGSNSCGCAHILTDAAQPSNGVIDLSSDPSPEGTYKISGPPSVVPLGSNISVVGDVNNDGFEDVALQGVPTGDEGFDTAVSVLVIYGKSDLEDVNTIGLTPEQGYRMPLSVTGGSFSYGVPHGLRGFSDQGASGVAVAGLALTEEGNYNQIAFTRAPRADEDNTVPLVPTEQGFGYRLTSYDPAATGTVQSVGTGAVGDLDGDGIDDLAQGVNVTVDGITNAGRLSVFFSKTPSSADITLGPEMSPNDGFSLVGAAGQSLGLTVAGLGDIDGDGLPDMAIGGRPSGGATSGAIYLVRGSDLMAAASTGTATQITDEEAVVSGAVNVNSRESNVSFQYGESSELGSETQVESMDASRKPHSVSATLSGLAPETTYHYRVVVTNDLGLTRYGETRSFTTDEKPETPKTPCEMDPTQAGCADYCKANPSSAGCKEPVARLSRIIVSPGITKVKRGKSVTIRATVVNTGDDTAGGVRLCATGSKKLVRVSRCANVGSLSSGAAKTVKFKVKVKRKAKRGKKATIKLSATATGLGSKKAKAVVRVR